MPLDKKVIPKNTPSIASINHNSNNHGRYIPHI